MELGHIVKRHRKKNGWTQKQLADKAGVGLNFVYQLEKNKPSVQLDCTVQVLSALDLNLTIEEPSETIVGAVKAQPVPQAKPKLPWD